MLSASFLLLVMVFLMMIFFNTKLHFLRSFLFLEAMMLTALMITTTMLSTFQSEPFMFLTLLTFAVIEAALGLSLLLSYIKISGSDKMTNTFL
uniref:NADH dehydrogenase subunit 4L n=1 Tax=Stereophaedusa ophidoon TaxID=1885734 RepID=A0A224ABN9_9EUPU|nr:NADH dehydrogenase subunit 4L [Stereophaedusa ophidoon]